ncbi:MAG: insulinase family protein [Proteobacteria bacterium]|nr:insulinase family protein [Pseudomonadota bacterium]
MKKFFFAFLASLIFVAGCKASAEDRFLDIQEVRSASGITAWLVEDHSLPIISIKFAFAGAGAAQDDPGKQGLAQLASNTLDEGAGDMDSQAFQKALADNSISLRYGAGRDDFTGSLKTLSRRKGLAFNLLRLSLTKPRFDTDAVERMRAANMTRVRNSLSDPEWIAARIQNDIAFAGHPYAMNSGGTLTTLRNITSNDLKSFAAARLTRDRLLIAASGDITKAELSKALDKIFGALPAQGALPPVKDLTVQGGREIALFRKDIPQTIISIIQPGIGRGHPDYHAFQIMNHLYGGSGFGSRLMEEVREKRGLTYGIYSSLYLLDHLKALTISTSTENGSAGEVLSLITAEMKKIQDTPVSDKELSDAKSYLIGSMPLALDSTDDIASIILGLRLDGLPADYLDHVGAKISAVTPADIQKAARQYLEPDALTTVVVGQPENITPTRAIDVLPNVE